MRQKLACPPGSSPEIDMNEEHDLRMMTYRVTEMEAHMSKMAVTLDALAADKQRRDGAIAAGNWITRIIWAFLGAIGAWFAQGQRL